MNFVGDYSQKCKSEMLLSNFASKTNPITYDTIM